MDETAIKELIKRWMAKGRDETDPFFQFFCYWICFNAWLEYKSTATTDAGMIKWLNDQTVNTSDIIKSYESMANTTVGQNALIGFVSMSPVSDSRNLRDDIVIENMYDRKHIIDSIYRIRCNLFHGGKRSTNTRDSKLVSCVNKIFKKWLSEMLALW